MERNRQRRLGGGRRRHLRLRQPGRRGQPQRRAHGAAARRTAVRRCRGRPSTACAAPAWTRSRSPRARSRPARCRSMIAGGVESMSRAPFVHGQGRRARSRARRKIEDTTIGWRFVNPLMKAKYGIDSMPETAENVAADFDVSRADQDAFALAQPAARGGGDRRGPPCRGDRAGHGCRRRRATPSVVEPRRASARDHARVARASSRASCDPTAPSPRATRRASTTARARVLLASADAAKRHGLTPRARIVAAAVAGVAPRIMGFGPAPAMRKVLAQGRARRSATWT